jgi:hypothetical protein
MRCEELRENLEAFETVELPAPAREHLASCPDCRGRVRDWRLARVGLGLLAEESVPELSVGFAARVVRRLEGVAEAGRSSGEFLERAGRRFVYASLLLALTALLFLLLPSSGPLRAPSTADLYFAGTETFMSENDPVLTGEPAGNQVPNVAGADKGSEGKQK